MFNPSLSINWFAVLLATFALQALGALWFMAVIPKAYGIALGRSDLAGRKPEPLFIVGPLVCGAVVTVTNAVLLRAMGVTSMGNAILFATLVGIGYLVATVCNVAINPNIPRPLLYGAVNAPFFLLSNIVTCAILVALP